MLDARQSQQLIDLTDHWRKRAGKIMAFQLPRITVCFDLNGHAAGQYSNYPRPLIRYNPYIATRQFESFCARTPPHEVAHYAIDQYFGDQPVKPHGKEWKALMQAMGCNPSTRHSYDMEQVPVRRQRRYRYRCDCREHQLSATRHNRILRQQALYHCRNCGAPLHPAD